MHEQSWRDFSALIDGAVKRRLRERGAYGAAEPVVDLARGRWAVDGEPDRIAEILVQLGELVDEIADAQHSVLNALDPRSQYELIRYWEKHPGAAIRIEHPEDSSDHGRPAGLFQLMAETVPDLYRACTPSVMLDQDFPESPLHSDVSVSYDALGTLSDRTGVFAHMLDDIAAVYGAERAWAGVTGTTGSNWAVARLLAYRLDNEVVLVGRGAHLSVPQALTDLGVTWEYIEGRYDPPFEAVLPAHPDDVQTAIARIHTDGRTVGAVMVNSPTYEGVYANIAEIRGVLDHNDLEAVPVIVDEAWGSHTPAYTVLRPHGGVAQGADLVVSSTHKQAGGLQGTAVIVLAHQQRIAARQVDAAMAAVTTTSPSYLLLGSIAWVYATLRADGEQRITQLAEFARQLRHELHHRADDKLAFANDVLARTAIGDGTGTALDPLKVTVALDAHPNVVGLQIANHLQSDHAAIRVVVEKAGINTIQFQTTYQLVEQEAAANIAWAFSDAVGEHSITSNTTKTLLGNPFEQPTRPAIPRRSAAAQGLRNGNQVPLDDAEGGIAGERVAAYPPGVPIILEGDRITRSQIAYLRAVCDAGGHLAASSGNHPEHDQPTVLVIDNP